MSLLSGCCYQTIRLQSSWYILEEDVKKSATYVSVLNTGNTAVTVETLVMMQRHHGGDGGRAGTANGALISR